MWTVLIHLTHLLTLYLNKKGQAVLDDDADTGGGSDFVIKPGYKSKVAKQNRRQIGLEYDKDVTSDFQLLQKILEKGDYNPSDTKMIDFDQDLSRLIVRLKFGEL